MAEVKQVAVSDLSPGEEASLTFAVGWQEGKEVSPATSPHRETNAVPSAQGNPYCFNEG